MVCLLHITIIIDRGTRGERHAYRETAAVADLRGGVTGVRPPKRVTDCSQ